VAGIPECIDVELACSGTVVIRPGDHLVIGVIGVLDEEGGELARQRVKAELPGVEVTILSGVSAMAVYRPG
jgi:hypothetical protein